LDIDIIRLRRLIMSKEVKDSKTDSKLTECLINTLLACSIVFVVAVGVQYFSRSDRQVPPQATVAQAVPVVPEAVPLLFQKREIPVGGRKHMPPNLSSAELKAKVDLALSEGVPPRLLEIRDKVAKERRERLVNAPATDTLLVFVPGSPSWNALTREERAWHYREVQQWVDEYNHIYKYTSESYNPLWIADMLLDQ
jgi:hypothetical protein